MKPTKQQDEQQDFPGYPHYPSKEDITRGNNHNEKLPINEQGSIDLPEVNDIPGQENITAAPLGELGDTAISSADEEDIVHGDSLDGNPDVDIVMGTEADVTAEDLRNLAATDGFEKVDRVDDDGELLNESTDLDVPGGEMDDANEAIGEEDEENNYYSLGDNDTVEDPNQDMR